VVGLTLALLALGAAEWLAGDLSAVTHTVASFPAFCTLVLWAVVERLSPRRLSRRRAPQPATVVTTPSV
jgi:hypothetical protein